MTADQREARKYFDGVLMAYRDCIEIADKIAASQPGFVAHAVKAGQPKHYAEIAALSGETVARQFAASIRTKLAIVEAMIDEGKDTMQ